MASARAHAGGLGHVKDALDGQCRPGALLANGDFGDTDQIALDHHVTATSVPPGV